MLLTKQSKRKNVQNVIFSNNQMTRSTKCIWVDKMRILIQATRNKNIFSCNNHFKHSCERMLHVNSNICVNSKHIHDLIVLWYGSQCHWSKFNFIWELWATDDFLCFKKCIFYCRHLGNLEVRAYKACGILLMDQYVLQNLIKSVQTKVIFG